MAFLTPFGAFAVLLLAATVLAQDQAGAPPQSPPPAGNSNDTANTLASTDPKVSEASLGAQQRQPSDIDDKTPLEEAFLCVYGHLRLFGECVQDSKTFTDGYECASSLATFVLSCNKTRQFLFNDKTVVGNKFKARIEMAANTLAKPIESDSVKKGLDERPCLMQPFFELSGLQDGELTEEAGERLFDNFFKKLGECKHQSQAKKAFDCTVKATADYGACMQACKDAKDIKKCGLVCAQQKLNGDLSDCKKKGEWFLLSDQALPKGLADELKDKTKLAKQLEPPKDNLLPAAAAKAARPIADCRRAFVEKKLSPALMSAKTEGQAQTALLDYFHACGAAGSVLPALPAVLAAALGVLLATLSQARPAW